MIVSGFWNVTPVQKYNHQWRRERIALSLYYRDVVAYLWTLDVHNWSLWFCDSCFSRTVCLNVTMVLELWFIVYRYYCIPFRMHFRSSEATCFGADWSPYALVWWLNDLLIHWFGSWSLYFGLVDDSSSAGLSEKILNYAKKLPICGTQVKSCVFLNCLQCTHSPYFLIWLP